MLRNLLGKIIGDPNEKELDRIRPLVEQVNALEPTYLWMTNEELRSQTDRLRARLEHGETLDDILPDAFALVRETSKRTVGMRPFDVQLIGGIVLHQGKVAEMRTGEGKTLVATLPIYLNALTGKGVHLVTVNDYLARYHAVWMGAIYDFLGLSVGLLQQSNKSFLFEPGYARGEYRHLLPVARGEAYAADITYGTNHEFGFDYLRDNLAYSTSQQVQRSLAYAIVDEVDNVFIDEARTPLIISGASEESDEEYRRFAQVARKLEADVDFEVDEKTRGVFLTEAGLARVEELTSIDNIYDPVNQRYIHYMEQAVKAQVIFQEGVDYIRQRDRIVLVDEFTGRLMPDRRLSDGLHQAIEAKHGLKIRPRMITQATITIQNYFRMYRKLAGMTGTALSEAEEFHKIYSLEVVVIPTNMPVIRVDAPDVVYRTPEAKMEAIVDEIMAAHERGQPVLVGTTSIEKSEELSRQLRARRIEHHVLNAKEHEREGRIIARAGEPGRVTVATNMAGRGVDIKLGGELPEETIEQAQRALRQRGIDPFGTTPEQFDSAIAEVDPDYALWREKVLEAGGLYVLGTERHEARRIDNQLRGRSGRQGEPGLSRFFLSLGDDLMRRFGGANVANLMARLGVEDDMPIEHGLVSRSIESAQTRVEGHNFDIRKHLLEYDDVMNQQREMIYRQRQRILTKDDLWTDMWAMIDEEIDSRRKELASQPERAWEFANFFDVLAPLSYAPVQVQKSGKGKRSKVPGAMLAYESLRYPYTLSAVRSVFLPFSISYLAHELASLPAGRRQPELVATVSNAVSEYRGYIMDQAIHESFARAQERYQEGWDGQKELLEQRIMTYLDMIEERGKAFDPRDMLDQVQRGLPVRLSISPQDLAGMEVDDIRALFEEAMVQSYHVATCDQLVRRVAGQLPGNLGLTAAPVSLLDPAERKRILNQAALTAYTDDARQRLARMADQAVDGKKGEDPSLFGWLSRVLALAKLDLVDLEKVMEQVTADRFDAWAEQTVAEIGKRSDPKPKRENETAVGQWLLDALTIVDQQSYKVDWRIPPAFLLLAHEQDLLIHVSRETLREHLQRCIAERRAVWGEAELARHGHLKLRDLDFTYFDALTRFWGRRVVGGSDVQIQHLSAEHMTLLECAATVYELRERQIGNWPMFDAIIRGLAGSIEKRLRPGHGHHDQPLLDMLEGLLQRDGVFDDAAAESAFLQTRLAELARADRDELASYLGESSLMPLRSSKISELEPALGNVVIKLLAARGRFTDEKRVQDFLIRQRLNDIGAQRAEEACRWLTDEQLKQNHGRTIAELEHAMREWVMQALRDDGLLWNEEARSRALTGPLSGLSDNERSALVTTLGKDLWPIGMAAGALGEAEQAGIWTTLEEAGLFLERDRCDQFGIGDLPALPQGLRDGLRDRWKARVREHLTERPGRDLPPLFHEHVRRHLDDCGYFLDGDRANQLALRSLSSLDGQTLVAIEESVGREILAEVDQRKFINLDRDLREGILQYLDRENIYRKSSKRRAFMQRPLAELDKAIYDGIAQHVGRAKLSGVRSQSIGSLPADVCALVQTHLQSSGELQDPDKLKAFNEESLDTLPPDTRLGLLAYLEETIEGLLIGASEQEVYDGMLLEARQFLTQQGYFTRDSARNEFAELAPEILEADLGRRCYQAVGESALNLYWEREVEALPAEVRERVLRAFDQMEQFVDQQKARTFLNTRLIDIAPPHREAIVARRAERLLLEIGSRPVSSLNEETRQALRTYLDHSGYFVDESLMQQLANQSLATLRRADWQALAMTRGTQRLKGILDTRVGDLEPAERKEILTYFRSRGHFLDEARKEQFRREGIAALNENDRETALARANTADRDRLVDASLANLPETLRWEVEYLAIGAAQPIDSHRMKGLDAGPLSELPSDLLDGFLRRLGYPHTRQWFDQQLGELPSTEHAVIRDFLGDRVTLELQKRVMLSFVSRLWIDYLTDMEDLRQGIGLEAFGQRDPLVEYKRRAYQMFQQLTREIRQGIVSRVFGLDPVELQIGTTT